jgi:hypothetical protein
MTPLSGWTSFYVIDASAAGALIGLQFVVITLISSMGFRQGLGQAGEAFSTPAVVHFGTVLLLSAVLSAPWSGIAPAAVLWSLGGLAGVLYSVIVARRMRAQTLYRPVFEDGLFHVLLPRAAYAMLAVVACAIRSHAREALFGVGAAALRLLFIGIHNAWDAVTYHVFRRKPLEQDLAGSEQGDDQRTPTR